MRERGSRNNVFLALAAGPEGEALDLHTGSRADSMAPPEDGDPGKDERMIRYVALHTLLSACACEVFRVAFMMGLVRGHA